MGTHFHWQRLLSHIATIIINTTSHFIHHYRHSLDNLLFSGGVGGRKDVVTVLTLLGSTGGGTPGLHEGATRIPGSHDRSQLAVVGGLGLLGVGVDGKQVLVQKMLRKKQSHNTKTKWFSNIPGPPPLQGYHTGQWSRWGR